MAGQYRLFLSVANLPEILDTCFCRCPKMIVIYETVRQNGRSISGKSTPTPEVVPVSAVDPFTSYDETVYATGAVNLRAGPGTSYEKVGGMSKGDSAHRVGIGTGDVNWSRQEMDNGSLVYVSSKYVSTEKPAVQAPAKQQQATPAQKKQNKPAPASTPAPSCTDKYTEELSRRNTAGFDPTKDYSYEDYGKALRACPHRR